MRKLLYSALTIALGLVPGLAQDQRGPVAGHYVLSLDGTMVGLLRSMEGGTIKAEVVTEPAAANQFAKKHIGQPKYGEFAVQLGFDLLPPVYDWISNTWSKTQPLKNGAVVLTDYQFQTVRTHEFTHALITETTIPACDGSSKEPGYLTIKFAPEITRVKKGDGDQIQNPVSKKQKIFIPSNFRLSIQGLEDACNKVSKVDAFTIKQTPAPDAPGNDREKEPGKLEFPNLKITLPEADSGPFADWFNSFVLLGNATDDQERNGTLELLAPNLKDVLATIKFTHLGIFALNPTAPLPDPCDCDCCRTAAVKKAPDKIRTVTVELYCEQMEFKLGPQAGE
jgi:hypothetical protein